MTVLRFGLKTDDIITVKSTKVVVPQPSRETLLRTRTGAWKSESEQAMADKARRLEAAATARAGRIGIGGAGGVGTATEGRPSSPTKLTTSPTGKVKLREALAVADRPNRWVVDEAKRGPQPSHIKRHVMDGMEAIEAFEQPPPVVRAPSQVSVSGAARAAGGGATYTGDSDEE
jgi:hypothetical protein